MDDEEKEKAYILSEIEKWKERKEFALGITLQREAMIIDYL